MKSCGCIGLCCESILNEDEFYCEYKRFNNDQPEREAAKKVLSDEMSDYTMKHIKEIDHLEDWIIDAMISFKKQMKK